MKLLGLDSALCLSPHPDDVELSMSGTIKKYTDTQFRILCCSVGTQPDKSSGIHRHSEIENFWFAMGCKNIELVFINDYINMLREDEWVNRIEENYLQDSRAIFTTSSEDSHYEHKIINRVATALIRHIPVSLIEYRSFSTLRSWVPNMFIQIDDPIYGLKQVSLEKIKTQLGKNYFMREVQESIHSDAQCAKRMLPRTEQFNIVDLYEN